MANEPVNGWDQRVYVGLETAFRTRVLPVAADAIQQANLDFGVAAGVGNVRARKDKTPGRDMTTGFVEGRVEPIGWTLDKPVMSRATAATPPEESDILKAAGFTETVGANVVYTIGTALPSSLWLLSVLGSGSLAYLAEHGLGGVVKQLQFTGGDTELMLKASGAVARKNWLGQAVGTLVDATDVTLAIDSAADALRMSEGFYQVESEVIEATEWDYSTGIGTVTRGAASTVAAAHASKAVYPYAPAPAPVGVEAISEAECTVTIGGATVRCTKFALDITTGVDHLPAETGSKYVQGTKMVRMDTKLSLELVLTKELVLLLGLASRRENSPIVITCGTAAGGIVTFSLPYCEIGDFPTPAPANDITIVSPPIRVRGNSGNDSLSITFA